MRIVLGNGSLAQYLPGGGHWSWFLQYPLALAAMGHEVLWLELLRSKGDPDLDQRVIRSFFERLEPYGLAERCGLLLFDEDLACQRFERAGAFGKRKEEIASAIRGADLMLDFCCAIREPMLSMFRRRVLLDFDPGHLQISALECDLGIEGHDVFLTIGARLGAPGCEVPTLGREWKHFEPLAYLPMWQSAPDPGYKAPFSSLTQWTWEELAFQGRTVSVSKRTAYLKYLEVPRRARRPFELAANIGQSDPAGDARLLEENGWKLVDPHSVAPTPAAYQEYIRNSRAEFMCPKPIHVELKTGWFSDRSVGYLATGRPVVAEETGFSERLPTGRGLLTFRGIDEALDAIAEVDGDYAKHSRAARELAEVCFDSRKNLEGVLAASAG